MRVLVVDDEVRLATALARGLTAEGFAVEVAHDGGTGLARALAGGFDAVVLDILLPGLSGYEVLKRLRAAGNQTPVLVLSAKDGEFDQADALDLGADDYLVKPFSYVVLVARLRALLRRERQQRSPLLTAGDITLDPTRRTVRRAGEELALTGREFDLLEQLLRADGRPVSKLDLLERVFHSDPDTHPNVVEVYIGYLRRKLGRDSVRTVRGVGYRMSG